MEPFQSAARSVVLLALAFGAASTQAQSYPARPIRLLSTIAGSTDALTRAVVQKAGEALGQPFVVENQPAANGMVAAEQTARALPDGYTLLVAVPGAIVVRGFLTKVMPYQPVKDFTAITQAASAISMIVVNPATPVRSVAELIEKSRNAKGITYSTNGIGASDHLAAELLNQMTGSNLVHVPHKTAVDAVTNAVNGEVQAYFGVYGGSGAMIRAGKLRPLAYINVRPSAAGMPDVPLVSESVPGFQSPPYWVGFFGPRAMPEPILRRLSGELIAALEPADMRARWLEFGFQVVASSPEVFTRVLNEDLERVGRIAKGAGIKPE